MRMDERKFLILQAIIDDYISTAMPVGSRTISRKSGVGFSPATIRNEMSDLEELGYLDQPHTSAGRIPSLKAYRLYVDHLMKVANLSEEESRHINDHLNMRADQTEEVIRSAARALSDATHYTSVIVAPQLNTLQVKRIQFVPVTDTTALMILVTTAGIVKDAVIQVPKGLTADHLYVISKTLTERLSDQPITRVREIFEQMIGEMSGGRQLLTDVMNVVESKLESPDGRDVVLGGTSNLLSYPEYADVNKAKNFLSVLETKDRLIPLLKQDGGMEITIRIGPENGMKELEDCSVVSATYRVGDHSQGTLGIIGPTRMNYSRVISVLEYMGRALSNMLRE
ncbi:MAG: heat-inducible transcriptional repressor HrcA [Clostridia bacterium]|nr:heat-inducible transcriptional repressor HrcA [Clostridia bacterium]